MMIYFIEIILKCRLYLMCKDFLIKKVYKIIVRISKELLDDNDIIADILDGDFDAYGVLMSRYERKLLSYVYYLMNSDTFASDVVQDAFIKAYQNLRTYDPKYKFSSWIFRICHNEAINAIKREKHLNHNVDAYDMESESTDNNVSKILDKTKLAHDLRACINHLNSKYKDVLILQYYKDMKYEEISEILQIPVSTVGVRSKRAKEALKSICQKEGVEYVE